MDQFTIRKLYSLEETSVSLYLKKVETLLVVYERLSHSKLRAEHSADIHFTDNVNGELSC